MKNMKHICIFVLMLSFQLACNENEFLKQESMDFLSPENSYVTQDDFEIALNTCYSDMRYILAYMNQWWAMTIYTETADLGYMPNRAPDESYNSPNKYWIPDVHEVGAWWDQFYTLVRNANVIISRIEEPDTKFTSEDIRESLKAEALFFRAYAYRLLAGYYGGVPLVLEEVKTPKRDFVRATREETWRQCIEDLEAAIPHLPGPDEVTSQGKICDAAAYHLLSELYISLEEWDKAIDAANEVIDSGKFTLMTERFGTRMNEPGNVWWDLFRRGNQNRASGNNEAILVAQFKPNADGGQLGGPPFVRNFLPFYRRLVLKNGDNAFIGATSCNCGYSNGGFRWYSYITHTIWYKSGWKSDIRNDPSNIRRDMVVDNPDSEFYGDSILANNLLSNPAVDTMRSIFPIFVKFCTPNNHPDYLYVSKETGILSGTEANNTLRDHYVFRLAETYLLRAEAYLGKGDKNNAAEDINVVRTRAKAPPVAPNEVNIDYILDERLRELLLEEYRCLTLSRLGLNYERMQKCGAEYNGDQISPHHNLWPIPYKEIENNIGAVLEQNPGY